jgi:hypothetical protein
LLQVIHRPTTSYHPASNGQVERQNQNIEQLLRIAFCEPATLDIDWDLKLSQVEIALNNACLHDSKYSSFYLNYGFHPTFIPDVHDLATSQPIFEPVKQFVDRIHLDQENFSTLLSQVSSRMRDQTDSSRAPATFKSGDLVLYNESLKNRVAGHPQSKLVAKYAGPYKILTVYPGNTYKLDMPTSHRVHPVIHASYLKPYTSPDSVIPADEDSVQEIDSLDRHDVMIHPDFFHQACCELDFFPNLDLFASSAHHQLTAYCSRYLILSQFVKMLSLRSRFVT